MKIIVVVRSTIVNKKSKTRVRLNQSSKLNLKRLKFKFDLSSIYKRQIRNTMK